MGRMNHVTRLGRLAVNDVPLSTGEPDEGDLDAKTMALVRLAALVVVGGAVPSYGAFTDAAVSAGASDAEIVSVLVGLVPVIGLPVVVAAAPKVALALGYDTVETFGWQSDG